MNVINKYVFDFIILNKLNIICCNLLYVGFKKRSVGLSFHGLLIYTFLNPPHTLKNPNNDSVRRDKTIHNTHFSYTFRNYSSDNSRSVYRIKRRNNTLFSTYVLYVYLWSTNDSYNYDLLSETGPYTVRTCINHYLHTYYSVDYTQGVIWTAQSIHLRI